MKNIGIILSLLLVGFLVGWTVKLLSNKHKELRLKLETIEAQVEEIIEEVL